MQPVSPADALRFERICRDFVQAGNPSAARGDGVSIGTLGEKMLHAVIKTYLCEDVSCHERVLSPSCRMVADVCRDGHVFEVQTGSFYPLKKKIGWYLANTDFHVTVVHPLPAVKYISWIDPGAGSISPRHRAPGKKNLKTVAKEVYWLSEFIGDPRLSVQVLFLEMEEFRLKDGWGKNGKRGSHRYDRVPLSLLGTVELSTASDYATHFLPADKLPDPFTAAHYAKATGMQGRIVYGMIHLLEHLSLIEATDKVGRAQGWRVV